MERIPIYTNIENLVEIFALDRTTNLFMGMKQMISKESELIFCEEEASFYEHDLYPHIAKEFTSGSYEYRCINDVESYLLPNFKSNLQERFENKSSILFSNDTARIEMAKEKNGILMAGWGNEKDVYNKLNFNKDFFRANQILTIGEQFTDYSDFNSYILPFSEIIINEPYLFVPESRTYNLDMYLLKNFKALFKVLLNGVTNKVNIVICTYVNEEHKHESEWYDNEKNSFQPLYDYIKTFLNELIGGARYKLWLVVSPQVRQARHDRYILTNYQYIESPAGLTYFDDRGNFINRGEGIHLYSIMHDDARKSFLPSVKRKIQTNVINSLNATKPERIFGMEQGNTYFLDFS
jgi:hypothetical protein